MGLGDNLMATGIAKGAFDRRVQIAFGDGEKIIWDKHSPLIFRGNPNIARPGMRTSFEKEWVPFYKGNRLYMTEATHRYVWNMDFAATPGELFLDERERRAGKRYGEGFILIEPNVPEWKSWSPNKDWGWLNYQRIVNLIGKKYPIAQFMSRADTMMLKGVVPIHTANFRDALSVLGHAKMYIGPEGGLHHGAAAMKVPAVVLFGGFIPPSVTGYAFHDNMVGSPNFCGSRNSCQHCADAMRRITVDEVWSAIERRL